MELNNRNIYLKCKLSVNPFKNHTRLNIFFPKIFSNAINNFCSPEMKNSILKSQNNFFFSFPSISNTSKNHNPDETGRINPKIQTRNNNLKIKSSNLNLLKQAGSFKRKLMQTLNHSKTNTIS